MLTKPEAVLYSAVHGRLKLCCALQIHKPLCVLGEHYSKLCWTPVAGVFAVLLRLLSGAWHCCAQTASVTGVRPGTQAMMQAAVQVFAATTGVNQYALSFIIPLGVCAYAMLGGLKVSSKLIPGITAGLYSHSGSRQNVW